MNKHYVFLLIFTIIIVSGYLLYVLPTDRDYEILFSYDTEESTLTKEKNQKKYKVAIIPKQNDIPYFNAVETGAKEAAEDLGIELIFQGPTLADSDLQIKTINELVEQDVHLIAVSAIDPSKLAPVLRQAQAKGVKVVTWDSDSLPSSRSFFINMVNPESLEE